MDKGVGKKIIMLAASVFILSACGQSGQSFHEGALDSETPATEDCLFCHSTDIRDTHYSKAISNKPSGYLFDRAIKWAKEGLGYITENSEKYDTCAASCHKFHKGDTKVARQWRRSAHGNPKGAAFTSTHVDGGICAVCHTGVGFAQYADESNDKYPIYKGGPKDTDPHLYIITCNACHDAKGYPSIDNPRLRKTGLVNIISGDFTAPGTAYYEGAVNAGNSAACVICHQARVSGNVAFDKIDATPADHCDALDTVTGVTGFSAFGPYQSHYLVSAALLYGVKGFEYNGTSYTPGNPFHQSLGCVGCHMARTEDENEGGHTFEPPIEVCKDCHGEVVNFAGIGTLRDMDGDGVAGLPKKEIRDLIDKINAYLASKGVTVTMDAYPYYRKFGPGWKEWELEAAFNTLLVYKDKGAYVHNYRYATQLLRDSYEKMTGTSLAGVRPSTGDDRPNADYWDVCP